MAAPQRNVAVQAPKPQILQQQKIPSIPVVPKQISQQIQRQMPQQMPQQIPQQVPQQMLQQHPNAQQLAHAKAQLQAANIKAQQQALQAQQIAQAAQLHASVKQNVNGLALPSNPSETKGYLDSLKTQDFKLPLLVAVIVFIISLNSSNNLLASYLPGFTINEDGSLNTTSLAIRGIVAGLLVYVVKSFI